MRSVWLAAALIAWQLAAPPCFCFRQEVQEPEVEIVDARPYRAPDEKVPDLAATTRALVERTNAFREHEKRSRLAINPKLAETARDFADYMARTGRYGHAADGADPGGRAVGHAYKFGLISENIAYAFNSAGFSAESLSGRLIGEWGNSPGHRRNMLDPDVTETGTAVARSDKTGHYFAVQLFARPESLNIRVEIANRSDTAVAYRLGDQKFDLPPRSTRIHEQGRPAELIVELPTRGEPLIRSFKIDGESRFVIVDGGGGTPRIQAEQPDSNAR